MTCLILIYQMKPNGQAHKQRKLAEKQSKSSELNVKLNRFFFFLQLWLRRCCLKLSNAEHLIESNRSKTQVSITLKLYGPNCHYIRQQIKSLHVYIQCCLTEYTPIHLNHVPVTHHFDWIRSTVCELCVVSYIIIPFTPAIPPKR